MPSPQLCVTAYSFVTDYAGSLSKSVTPKSTHYRNSDGLPGMNRGGRSVAAAIVADAFRLPLIRLAIAACIIRLK